MRIEVWIDGACGPKNPGGYGGWGAILCRITVDGHILEKHEYSGGVPAPTTNQRMEITAAIEGLSHVSESGTPIQMVSDSQYVVNTMTKGWRRKKNVDLWNKLDAEVAKHSHVSWRWVRGHDGLVLNQRADLLASCAVVRAGGSPHWSQLR